MKVQLLTELDTRMVEVGDRVEAKLLENVSDNGIVIARFGDLLEGWISSLEQSRRAIIAKWPSRSWLNANAAMGIYFHQILRGDGKVLKFQASLAPQTMLTAGERQGVALATNKHGKLTVYFPALKYAAASLAIEGAGYASGPFKPVAGPVISAAVGAVHPPYAYDSPVPESEPHKRLKGFLKGAVKGLPGGFIITGVVNHGREICIHEGTELDVALESDLSMQIPEQKIAQAP